MIRVALVAMWREVRLTLYRAAALQALASRQPRRLTDPGADGLPARWGHRLDIEQRLEIARTILADHFSVPRPKVSGSAWLLGDPFEKTAIASLPNGPWTMTSQDVSRFLDMLTEK